MNIIFMKKNNCPFLEFIREQISFLYSVHPLDGLSVIYLLTLPLKRTKRILVTKMDFGHNSTLKPISQDKYHARMYKKTTTHSPNQFGDILTLSKYPILDNFESG